jgi:hypothetical protein
MFEILHIIGIGLLAIAAILVLLALIFIDRPIGSKMYLEKAAIACAGLSLLLAIISIGLDVIAGL